MKCLVVKYQIIYIFKYIICFRLQCRILEVLPPSHQNGYANGHVGSTDGETIIISDSDDSETHSGSFQNG